MYGELKGTVNGLGVVLTELVLPLVTELDRLLPLVELVLLLELLRAEEMLLLPLFVLLLPRGLLPTTSLLPSRGLLLEHNEPWPFMGDEPRLFSMWCAWW